MYDYWESYCNFISLLIYLNYAEYANNVTFSKLINENTSLYKKIKILNPEFDNEQINSIVIATTLTMVAVLNNDYEYEITI